MSETKAPHVDMMRSPLGRARGLGPARRGSHHWWAQRLTSVALVPLSLWFICAVIRLEGASRGDVAAWMSGPLPIVLTIALVAGTFYHLQLGLQVIIEDYVHNEALRLASVLVIKGATFLLALACVISALRLGL
jgi:succinate dehydrogenase / fumarate reductase membrane anchor subunit